MKTKNILKAGALALATATLAFAQTEIRITGSTAFRAATHTAIQNILNPGFTYAYTGTSFTGASAAVFHGTTVGTNVPVTIKTGWAGSVGGIQAIAQNPRINAAGQFIASSVVGTTGGQSGASATVAQVADVTMSDSKQASTPFVGGSFDTLIASQVGVVPFVWVKGFSANGAGSAALSRITNMTPSQAQLLLGGGLPTSMLTGNASDAAVIAYATGRDEDSGTRLVSYAESGFGVLANPNQYQPITSGSTITGIQLWPAATVLGTNYPVGHSGFSSGGTLADTLKLSVTSGATDDFGSPFVLISYFGINDANRVAASLANALTYNGVAYSDNAVRYGSYTFWSYEWLMYRNDLSSTAKTVADQLAARITNFDAPVSGIQLSTMAVTRDAEGTIVLPQ